MDGGLDPAHQGRREGGRRDDATDRVKVRGYEATSVGKLWSWSEWRKGRRKSTIETALTQKLALSSLAWDPLGTCDVNPLVNLAEA
mmetsp:Transcript_40966/g.128958  ORF Transcript_40966/g.128958 Transcript_40966/m.128958 type:complete len:86 (-) Transcript_40966:152-409(-)